MKTIIHEGTTYRLPFADLFRELTSDEAERLDASIREHQIGYPVLIYDSPTHGENCVVDGANRLRIGSKIKGCTIPFKRLRACDDELAQQTAWTLNADRRHMSAEDYQTASAHRAARIKRVTTARVEGNSLPLIAEEEEVSLGQVQRDLKKAEEHLSGPINPPEKVKGKDGKEQSSTKKEGSKKPGRKPKKPKVKPGDTIIITPEDERKELEKRKKEPDPKDSLGVIIPPGLRDTFLDPELADTIQNLKDLHDLLDQRYQLMVRSLSRKPYPFCIFSKAIDKLNQVVNPKTGLMVNIIAHLAAGTPFAVCECGGKKDHGTLHKECRGGGYLPEWRYEELTGKAVAK